MRYCFSGANSEQEQDLTSKSLIFVLGLMLILLNCFHCSSAYGPWLANRRQAVAVPPAQKYHSSTNLSAIAYTHAESIKVGTCLTNTCTVEVQASQVKGGLA